jgi:hypothetical protein
VVTPLIQDIESLGSLRALFVISALGEVMPSGLQVGEPVIRLSLAGAVAILLAWTSLPVLAGAWRTLTRDA